MYLRQTFSTPDGFLAPNKNLEELSSSRLRELNGRSKQPNRAPKRGDPLGLENREKKEENIEV
jgi:hypothetical protein